MEPWYSKYAIVTPLGSLAFALLWWTVDGQKGLPALAEFVNLGIITFATFLILMEEVVAKMFYTLEKLKRKGQAEARRSVVAQLQAIAGDGPEAAGLQRLLEMWEQQEAAGQASTNLR